MQLRSILNADKSLTETRGELPGVAEIRREVGAQTCHRHPQTPDRDSASSENLIDTHSKLTDPHSYVKRHSKTHGQRKRTYARFRQLAECSQQNPPKEYRELTGNQRDQQTTSHRPTEHSNIPLYTQRELTETHFDSAAVWRIAGS